MLSADRQLLDAHLRNELQQLRQIEITNVVNRFQSCITPATLIAGFSMVGIAALDFTINLSLDHAARFAEPVFYLATASALATSLYVTAVSSIGIIFGQRLTVQATTMQGAEHAATVQELNQKFLYSLTALGISMACVVLAATAVIWVKDPSTPTNQDLITAASDLPSSDVPGNYFTSICSTCIAVFMFMWTLFSMGQMFARLHTSNPESANLHLRTTAGGAVDDPSEFYVSDSPSTKG